MFKPFLANDTKALPFDFTLLILKGRQKQNLEVKEKIEKPTEIIALLSAIQQICRKKCFVLYKYLT